MFQRDVLGSIVALKHLLVTTIGLFTYPNYAMRNKLILRGTDSLFDLPDRQVLFVSNHQTYFADVIGMLHAFAAVKWGYKHSLRSPLYLLKPRTNVYFVAAEETMNSGLVPRILGYAGAVPTTRTWREGDRSVNRGVRLSDYDLIGRALACGWVITFPQGTTTPLAPGRRGVCHIIKRFQPTVVPVIIQGFDAAFHKKSLALKKASTPLSIRFKPPMEFGNLQDPDAVLFEIMKSIEQV